MIGDDYNPQRMARQSAGPREEQGIGYPNALAERIGFLLARAHLVAREEADRRLGELGLTARGYAALATLASDGPVSQKRLSERIRMDPATMVDVIDALEQSGHIQRRRNPEDRREYGLHTTPKGRALYARAQKAIDAAEAQTIRNLSPEEARVLMGLLGRIAHSGSGSPVTKQLMTSALGQ
jgi:DNA-binding MarR family transcriptional regulator